jgi:hypothetical protein
MLGTGGSPVTSYSTILSHTHTQTKSHKRAGGVAQGVGPEFKRQYCKINNK